MSLISQKESNFFLMYLRFVDNHFWGHFKMTTILRGGGSLRNPKRDYVIYVRILIIIPKVVADWKFAAMVIDR